jgi:hypothetical protein
MVDDELKLRHDMNRGGQAAQLLDNPMLVEAFQSLEEIYLVTWKATGVLDTDRREKLWLAVQVVGKVRRHLQETLSSGQLASRQIERDFAQPKRFGIV